MQKKIYLMTIRTDYFLTFNSGYDLSSLIVASTTNLNRNILYLMSKYKALNNNVKNLIIFI